ncbi:MAG: TolC family protein [Acidobacteria bacterium]|nr:TolC family protein [Acidobacteriota bacterium]
MNLHKKAPVVWASVCLTVFSFTAAIGQEPTLLARNGTTNTDTRTSVAPAKPLVESVLPNYYDPQDGTSVDELIKRALGFNQEIIASRLEIDKARARLQQARLRPNPTLEFEQESGRLVGNGGDGQFTVGASLPIEIYGRRSARVSSAQIAIEASEAEVRNRERVLVANVLTNYAEALGALRELDVTERLLDLDLQTARVVQIRVNEGEIAPLELNLLQAEVERLRSRRQLAEGRLQSALTQLKLLTGVPFEDSLRLREQIDVAVLPTLPATKEAAVDIGLRTRPDVALAQLEEQVATAGLRLVRAQSRPDLTAYTRYSQGRSTYDAPTAPFAQRDRSLTFGVAIGLPLFNKNQGAKAEAEISIRQAQARREFAERAVRGEILSAYQRFEAASRAVSTLQTSAIPRSTQNVETFRKVYQIGEIKITELIAEQRRLLDATRDLTEALTQRYRSQADLSIALGAGAFLPAPK